MRKKHLDFLIKFHKPTSRHLYLLRNGGVDLNSALTGRKGKEIE